MWRKKNIFIVVYRQDENDGILEQIENLGLTPYKVVTEPKFHWEKVTELYNEVKMTKPNDWWIVSDDDEIQIYPKPIEEMIDECEVKGWEFITGGFLDRIGEDGSFPIVDEKLIYGKYFHIVVFLGIHLVELVQTKCV